MAEVKFIRGDGEEFLAEPGSAAFELMEKDGNFTRVAEESATEGTETSEEVVYTEAEAIEQNDGVDESSAATEAAAAPAAEKRAAKGKK